MKRVLFVVASALIASPAHAGITQINFSGGGHVTYAEAREFEGILIEPPVHVGDRVTVRGTVRLGDGQGEDPPVPNDYTGVLNLSESDLFYRISSFTFDVRGGAVGADSRTFWPYRGATLVLEKGRLRAISLYVYDEFEQRTLGPSYFDQTYGYSGEGTTWGGSWTLHQPVPEPAAWACLLLGFGLTGAAIRRRRGRPVPA